MRERLGPSAYLYVYVAGALLVLVGSVLPWLQADRQPIWGWDVSVLWSFTGDVSRLSVQPSSGVLVLLAGIGLSVPVVWGRPIPLRLEAVVSAVVVLLGVLTVVRSLTFPNPVVPHVGLAAVTVGGVLAAIGSLR